MFWRNALANFVGSVAAAGFLWFLVTRFYELPRSRKQARELVSMSYALLKFELVFNELYCRELLRVELGRIPAGFPVTQGWETLHSTEAFRYLPPSITGKLIVIYSLLFRLRGNVEFVHRLLLEERRPIDGPNPYSILLVEVSNLTKQVAEKILIAQSAFAQVLQNEIDKLSAEDKKVFDQAYQLHQAETKRNMPKAAAG
ncbi:MAG TPA: hypothetical protein VGR03_03090 [Candidatus Acidoferrum sp.]|nr:hypothetical protein [Candidatus Acidoferrum sp.]